jgi:antitoxin
MKYSYRFEMKQHHNGSPILLMRLPEEIGMVESFLYAEVHSRNGSHYITSAISDVLTGVSEYMEVAGNVYGLEIRPKTTMLVNEIDPLEEQPCEIETKELKEIIEIWLDEKDKLS